MKNPSRLLACLAVSAFALFALTLGAWAQDKDAPAKDAKSPAAVEPTPPVPPVTPAAPVETPAKPPVIVAPLSLAPPAFTVQPAAASTVSTLGSLIDAKLQVELSPYGASIHTIKTADYRKTVEGKEPYTVLSALETRDDNGNLVVWERPFSANTIVLNKEHRIDLWQHKWELITPGQYRIILLDGAGKPALEITRTYSLGSGDGGYDLTCRTSIKNLSDKAITAVWEQNAHGDLERDSSYQGDTRNILVGYHNLDYDENKVDVYTDKTNFVRVKAIDEFAETGLTIWPRENVPKPNELLWIAMNNRYFTTVLHRPIPVKPEGSEGRVVGQAMEQILEPKIGMRVGGQLIGKVDTRVLMLTVTSKPIELAPGATGQFDLCLYAGPRLKTLLNEEPYATLKLGSHLVRYEMGCSMCLFQGLANFLLGFLKVIHAVVFDWGFAIIILVLVVRLLLHPITKKAQINMTRMSKQMATLQPELAKLKERYKNDSAKQQQEMMKLYREKGVNPMGFLGCLPMFLQMPIWVALYAMLYGAIELRHEPAFWGVFQLFGDWGFLRDLSAPDNFIKFGEGGFDLPLCGLHITNSLNILPILMAVVFFFQQKLTTPPPTNEQMEQQQKMMKYMTLIFPIFFYAAPSGLTLYIMASSLAGIVDSYIVRKHIKAEEAAGTLFTKKPPKPGGFMDRMQKMIESKQRELEAKQAELKGKRPGDKNRK